MLCCCPGGEAVGQAGLKAPCWGSGGAGGGGEVAMEATGLLLLKLSEALRRENMVRASGKLGGVAGVLAGVHICGKETRGQGSPHLLPPTRAWHKTPVTPCCGIWSPQSCTLLTVLPTSSSTEGSRCCKSSWQRTQTGPPVLSQVKDTHCSTTHWCHAGPAAFWLCGYKAQAQLPPPRRLGTLQPYWAPVVCVLQIANCPRESNKAAADSKSLRHICPSRLQAAGAGELRPSLGTAGREQRQAAPTCGCLHTSRHSAPPSSMNMLAPVSSQGPVCVAAAGWEAPSICECVYTGQCFRLLQALSAMLG